MGNCWKLTPKLKTLLQNTPSRQNVMHNLLFTPDAQTEEIRYHESLGKAVRRRAHKASQIRGWTWTTVDLGYRRHCLTPVAAEVSPEKKIEEKGRIGGSSRERGRRWRLEFLFFSSFHYFLFFIMSFFFLPTTNGWIHFCQLLHDIRVSWVSFLFISLWLK